MNWKDTIPPFLVGAKVVGVEPNMDGLPVKGQIYTVNGARRAPCCGVWVVDIGSLRTSGQRDHRVADERMMPAEPEQEVQQLSAARTAPSRASAASSMRSMAEDSASRAAWISRHCASAFSSSVRVE